MSAVPLWTREEKGAAIVRILQPMNARGITSVTDATLGPGVSALQGGILGPECIGVYNDLRDEGALTVRVNVLYLFGAYGAISLGDFEESVLEVGVRSGLGDESLQIGFKFFADGIPQTRTAWMDEDYADGGNGAWSRPGRRSRSATTTWSA